MLEVIEFLFEGLLNRQIPSDVNIEEIAHELPKLGFEAVQVESALEWLNDTIMNEAVTQKSLEGNIQMRIYSAMEQARISTEARGLLYFLEQNNLITASVREFIIERALELRTNYIGKEELRWVLLFVMMNSEARSDILAWLAKNVLEEELSDVNVENDEIPETKRSETK